MVTKMEHQNGHTNSNLGSVGSTIPNTCRQTSSANSFCPDSILSDFYKALNFNQKTKGHDMIRHLMLVMLFASGISFAEADIAKIQVGDKITGQLTVGKNTFPLPTGEWEVANISTWDLNACQHDCFSSPKQKQDDMKTIQLIKTNKGKLIETMLIETPVNNSAFIGRANTTACDKKTGYFYTDFDSRYNLPECLRLYHVVNYFEIANLNKFYSTVKEYFAKNNIEYPRTVIHANYFYASEYGPTAINFTFNPEAAGFSPSTIKHWEVNEWHSKNQTPEQKKFSDRAVAWAKEMAATMQKSIKEKQVTPIPDFMMQPSN